MFQQSLLCRQGTTVSRKPVQKIMSNPFDQFGSDLTAALPAVPQPSDYQAATYGAPPPQQYPLYGAPPPSDVSNNPYGMPSGNPYGAHDSNSYGLPQEAPPAPMMNSNPYGAPQMHESVNSYGAPPPQDNLYGAPPLANLYGAPPPVQDMNAYGAQPPHDVNPYGAPMEPNPYGLPPTTTPSADGPSTSGVSNPYAAPSQSQDPFGGGASNPYGLPSAEPSDPGPYGAVPPVSDAMPPTQPDQNTYADPWGQAAPEQQPQTMAYGLPPQPQQQQPPASDPYANALVPSQQQSNPYAAYGAPPPPQPQYGQMVPNPYGGGPPPPAFGYGHPSFHVPPPPAPVDPFSVFESQKAPEPPAPEPVVATGPDPTAPDDDFWGSFGKDNPEAAEAPAVAPAEEEEEAATSKTKVAKEDRKGDEGLPPGGEWYDARIFTPTLGVMFFKPQELTDSLFLNTDKEVVKALGERPVVAFIVEGSSARSAGVELGHVLLKVNGVDVRSPKEASRLIKEGPRPLPLLFYVPNTEVVTAEGEHMVKYDTKETIAPNSAKEWKPKYVVIGGIIAQPWMMNMYRSKVRLPTMKVAFLCFCVLEL